MKQAIQRVLSCFLIMLLVVPPGAWAQDAAKTAAVKQEELDQLLAPIALYPDSLVAQILMASTYPLEIVHADRFAKQNKNLKGDALTKALETQTWDPSVKSLVNFPQVLAMMSEKLDMTQKLGDAFLADQKAVMSTIQNLRAKAQAAGHLKTTKEQTVIVEQKIIKIEPANPQVVYVPVYNPTIVYGPWWYPAYPPYYYYPPGYVVTPAPYAFVAGVALGVAWGYAWGNTNWNGGSVNINNSQNININNNINRTNIQNLPANGQGQWQHNPANRQGVPYSNRSVQQRYNQASPAQKVDARQAYRGFTGSALTPTEQQQVQQVKQNRQQQPAQPATQQLKGPQTQQARGGEQGGQNFERGAASARNGAGLADGASGLSRGGGAFEGVDRGGGSAKSASQRGSASRSSGGGGRRR